MNEITVYAFLFLFLTSLLSVKIVAKVVALLFVLCAFCAFYVCVIFAIPCLQTCQAKTLLFTLLALIC
jgi:glucan phosphoethanolaminetransferase (alkaline phosphatase superfamily)